MDIQEQTNEQGQEKRSYENSPWINVYDWQVQEHQNQETGEKFWDVKLASGTFIEAEAGQKLDVGRYHFTTNVEPAMTFGEPGDPKAMRGIHFPEGWEIVLRRFERVSAEDQAPVFKEVGRVEGVTPQQLASGIAERNAAWRTSHKKDRDSHVVDKSAQEQKQFGNEANSKDDKMSKRAQEPSL